MYSLHRVRRHPRILLAALLVAASLTAGCVGSDDGLEASGQAWPAGSEMFRSSDRWLGGDGAITVELPDGRILWLFGDSRVAPDGQRSREEAFFLSNTMAIQRGADPANASMRFHWRTEDPEPEDPLPPPVGDPDPPPQPRPIVPDEKGGDISYWPSHGVEVDGKLLLFYSRIYRGDGVFDFEGRGWAAFLVDDPSGPPSGWKLDRVEKTNPFGDNVSVGAGGAFVHGDFVLLYALQSDRGSGEFGFVHHEPHLFRWPVEAVLGGDLTAPEIYDPAADAWRRQSQVDELPEPLFEPGAPGFSVHHDEASDRWLQVQISGFPTGPVEIRSAPSPTGPWSERVEAFTPPEADQPNVTTYLAYAHPSLTGADLVVGYSTNALSDDARERNPTIGYPRLAKVHLADGEG